MFGPFANSISRKDFKLGLGMSGWKYFEVDNLNELFAIKFDEFIQEGIIKGDINQINDSEFFNSVMNTSKDEDGQHHRSRSQLSAAMLTEFKSRSN